MRIRSIFLGVVSLFWATYVTAAELGDDGLHKQPWFTDSFLEMADDLAEAGADGKDLLILIEQQGCPYCRELHEVNFTRQQIVDHLKEYYMVVQLNLFGAREVVDFDGEALEERALAVKWGVNFTPTVVIFPSDASDTSTARAAEAFRMPGYFKPFHFLKSLEFVTTDAYQDQVFQRYLQDIFQRMEEKGETPDVW
ncbi:Thioredoxin-related protein [Aliiroseovarius sediminilitoris]|uniref:Thioredoxin-related protein n=1 Tax=Aliiroseovarius sediminilitoris TaxID=1173584 RepID=A0A1I0PJH6_9RHOB|nr:thioredoxin family protein [Aliiroseovarius sediminilitoris]SEW14606.1 Thioredoxin-related protein [Aliiroseovarius sediminilitoris]